MSHYSNYSDSINAELPFFNSWMKNGKISRQRVTASTASHADLNISLGKSGVTENIKNMAVERNIRKFIEGQRGTDNLLNSAKRTKLTAPTGAPPMNPTQKLLGLILSPMYPPLRNIAPGSISLV